MEVHIGARGMEIVPIKISNALQRINREMISQIIFTNFEAAN